MDRLGDMDILWEPETGKCSECGDWVCRVRVFSSSGRVRTFCFPCWNASQFPQVMSSLDWTDDERVAFEPEERPSQAA